ncbi:MAG: 5-formyltetrahydrofolate cyclo-ligase [Candidatus Hydrogenedentota bacterium]
MEKEDFRFMIQKRLETIKKNKKIYDKRMIEILQNDIIKDQEVILGYFPLPDEPDLRDLYDLLIKKKKILCAPVYTGEPSQIEVRRFNSSLGFKKWKGKYMNPTGKKIDLKNVELAFVPGLAFDRHGYRIGRGGGYFDRLLAKNKKMYKVGLCYNLQIFDSFKDIVYPHDVKMDRILIETGFVK